MRSRRASRGSVRPLNRGVMARMERDCKPSREVSLCSRGHTNSLLTGQTTTIEEMVGFWVRPSHGVAPNYLSRRSTPMAFALSSVLARILTVHRWRSSRFRWKRRRQLVSGWQAKPILFRDEIAAAACPERRRHHRTSAGVEPIGDSSNDLQLAPDAAASNGASRSLASPRCFRAISILVRSWRRMEPSRSASTNWDGVYDSYRSPRMTYTFARRTAVA